MRLLVPASLLAIGAAILSTGGPSQTRTPAAPNPQVSVRSQAILSAAGQAAAENRLEAAADLAETALVVDPGNRAAYTLLGDVARRQGLPGKAIRFYREALALDKADRAALSGQGQAYVAKGAVTKARENLSALNALCKGKCSEEVTLAAAIERGPPVAQAQTAPAPAAEQ